MEDTYELFQQGRQLLAEGHPAQATVPLEKARRREPDKASIREALGVAYIRIRRYHEAAAEFEFILESAPANDYAHYCLGRCLERLGDPSTALGHYKLAVLLRPSVDYYQQALDNLSE